LTYWKPELYFGIEYSVEVWNKDIPCEKCTDDDIITKGSYILRDDKNSMIGACRKHIEGKTVLKVVELPYIHKY